MKKYTKIISALFLIQLSMLTCQAQTSPNGKVRATAANDMLKVEYNNGKSWQQIFTADFPGINGSGRRHVSEEYTMLLGKRSQCKTTGVEAIYSVSDGRVILVRASNDGVAFRALSHSDSRVKSEAPVTVDFSSATNNWLLKWSDSYEDFFPKNTATKEGDRWGFPSLFEYSDGVFALLSEADIDSDNAASCLYSASRAGLFRIVTDENPNNPKQSSWKTVIIGSLSDIVESTSITDLSANTRLSDTSWIEPGVASWVYWAYNHGSNDFNIIKKYVDMAAEMKLPYVLIDAEWDEMDKLASNEGKTVEDAVRYAVDRGVKPIIWYNSSVGWINGAPGPKFRLNKPEDREREFAWCEKIGVKGVKIDFFSGDTNLNMKYMIELLECAAKHHLLVNFHGATVTRGWQRTYPNLVSTEGVYGAEWYNNRPTLTNKAAAHNATLPFTRNVIGSMDYTPCAFTDSQHPHITTHAHELALTALFESGIQHLADRPESFLAQPQQVKDYLSQLPTAWDDTRLLSGYPGENVVMARRKGTTWYIAGINGKDDDQTLQVATAAYKKLGIGKATVLLFEDGDPWKITRPAAVPKSIKCKPRGGFVMVVKAGK